MAARKPSPAHSRKGIKERHRSERDAMLAQRRDEIEARARSLAADAEGVSVGGAAPAHRVPGAFHLLYESKDQKLCLYEDAEGHLTAADSSKFA